MSEEVNASICIVSATVNIGKLVTGMPTARWIFLFNALILHSCDNDAGLRKIRLK
jgi:hypothetical protein